MFWLLITLFLLSASPDGDPLTLAVRPKVAVSPGAIRATARIEPHENNRRLTLTAESPRFRQSSTVSLDGLNAVGGLTRVFEPLPEGVYRVEATLERSDGTKLKETLEAKVLGPRKD